jgi:hypothetical protein
MLIKISISEKKNPTGAECKLLSIRVTRDPAPKEAAAVPDARKTKDCPSDLNFAPNTASPRSILGHSIPLSCPNNALQFLSVLQHLLSLIDLARVSRTIAHHSVVRKIIDTLWQSYLRHRESLCSTIDRSH